MSVYTTATAVETKIKEKNRFCSPSSINAAFKCSFISERKRNRRQFQSVALFPISVYITVTAVVTKIKAKIKEKLLSRSL